MNKKKSDFDKVFSAWDILVIAFGAMIGWGWVVSTGGWIEKGGVVGAALGFAIGGVMIFFVGLTYAELTAAMPQCGGEHVFSHRAMGPVGSFVCTWAIILGYVGVTCFEACAFPTIITYLWPGFLKGYLYTVAGFDIYASWLIVAIVVAFLIMVINIMGAKTAAMAVAFRTSVMAKVIIVGGMCGIITSWNSFMIGGSRAMYSMAESYMIPKMFSKLHPKHKTPINALILIGVLTMLAPFAGRVMMVWICDAGNFGCCMAYCMVSLSFLILRKKEPDMPRPYKVKHYKFVGTMAVLMSGFMVCMYCIPGSGGNLILPEWGMVVAWSLLGVVFYAICKSKYKEDFGSLVELISDEDSATLMPEADEEELDEVIDHAIDVVLGV